MTFPIKTWEKLNYNKAKRSYYERGYIGEFVLKENRRIIDSLKFKNNHEFNITLSILKKYGYVPEEKKDEVKEEINLLNLYRNKEEKK